MPLPGDSIQLRIIRSTAVRAIDSVVYSFCIRSSMVFDPGTSMIALHFSRTELELLVKAIEIAGQTCWPTGDDRVRVHVLRRQLEKAIADHRMEGWQGFNQ